MNNIVFRGFRAAFVETIVVADMATKCAKSTIKKLRKVMAPEWFGALCVMVVGFLALTQTGRFISTFVMNGLAAILVARLLKRAVTAIAKWLSTSVSAK